MSTVVKPKRSSDPIRPSAAPPAGPDDTKSPRAVPKKRWPWAVGAALLLLIAVGTLAGSGWITSVTHTGPPLVTYTVEKGELKLSVTERGNLESQEDLHVICEVDDVGGDGINGTPIVWIVENGKSVKKGDLIVEFDSTSHRDRLDQKTLDVEAARAEQIQAQVQYENQKTQNETTLAEAQLKVELAELALRQFGDEEAGTFQIELQDIELQVQEAEANQLIEQTNLQGVEQLYKLGYRSSGELAQARLNSLRAQRQLASAISKKRELVEYQYNKTIKELKGALESAQRALQQVELDNEALLAQARARLEAANEALRKEEETLARFREQVEKCTIHAPQDGMVAYATGSGRRREEIREGAPVRYRQTILTLPNLKKMQVKTSVHESVLDQIDRGMRATVRVDAFAERSYPATVQSVAVLPDQGGWFSSDTKVYETVVTIDDEVTNLKPGMTAVVEIHIDHLYDVLSVPIQAVVQIEDQNWLYVQKDGRLERRLVEVGATNDKFVEIRQGLSEGEKVVLNPMTIPEEVKRLATNVGRKDQASAGDSSA